METAVIREDENVSTTTRLGVADDQLTNKSKERADQLQPVIKEELGENQPTSSGEEKRGPGGPLGWICVVLILCTCTYRKSSDLKCDFLQRLFTYSKSARYIPLFISGVTVLSKNI